MPADAMATCVAKASAAMVLTIQNKWVIVFQPESFHLPAPSQCSEMTDKFMQMYY